MNSCWNCPTWDTIRVQWDGLAHVLRMSVMANAPHHSPVRSRVLAEPVESPLAKHVVAPRLHTKKS